MIRVISIINQKGGVGKTTTAVNLAAYMAKSGKKILLIDLDPQGNATSGLGVDKFSLNKNIKQSIIESIKIDNLAVKTVCDDVWLVPTNSDLASAEIELVNIANRETRLRESLAKSKLEYDYVIIDCPPSLGLLTINALAASTDVIIPLQGEYYAMEGLSQLLQIIEQIQNGLNPTLQIMGILITMYDSRTALSKQVKEEMLRVFDSLVFKTEIPRNVRLAEAPSHGKPIVLYDKWSKGARSYKALAKEVIERAK